MRRILVWLVILTLLAGGIPVSAQQPGDPAVAILARMSPLARVGQLFIVTFPGTDTAETSAIYDLIVNKRIGGVLLTPENGNILNEGDTPTQVATLTSQLQQLAWNAALPLLERGVVNNRLKPIDTGVTVNGVYIGDEALYRGRHRLADDVQTLRVEVDGVPRRAVVDPDHLLIDRDLRDNGVMVRVGRSGADTAVARRLLPFSRRR